MKRLMRILIVNGCLVAAFFVGKNKWIEFRDNSDSNRYSQIPYIMALDCYRTVLGMIPFAAAHQALADSYLEEGLEDRAVEEYKKALEKDPRSLQAYLVLSNIYLRKGSYKEALELLRKAELSIPDHPDIKSLRKRDSFTFFLVAGVKALKKGDLLKAREFLSSALEINPDSAMVHYLLAFSTAEKHGFYRREDHLKKAIKMDPNLYQARESLGNIYFDRGDFESAIKQYRFLLASKGDDPFVLNMMGLSYMNLERYDMAIPVLEKAVDLDPLNVATRYSLAAVCRDQGLPDKAIAGFMYIIRQMNKPDYPNIHNDLGDIYKKKGREQEALKEYRTTLEYGQKKLSQGFRNPPLLVELAHAYNGIKDYAKAQKLVQEALIQDPHNVVAYVTLANIYRNTNHLDAAIATLEKAKAFAPRKFSFIDDTISDIKRQMALSRR